MSETAIWTITPSQLMNIRIFLQSALIAAIILFFNYALRWLLDVKSPLLLLPLILPLAWSTWNWLVVNQTKYILTSERLKTQTGVFTIVTNNLELYRVKDHRIEQPWYLRLFGLGNILLVTSDKSTEIIVIAAVTNVQQRTETLRKQVEHCREARKVREVDFR